MVYSIFETTWFNIKVLGKFFLISRNSRTSPLVCIAVTDTKVMGMLDRYKKKGGFFQLLQLLETSPAAKREQFLKLIEGESPAWEEALRTRVLTVNRVYGWDPQFLVEIFSRTQPLTLANALHGNPPEQIEQLLSCLPPISKRKITDLMAESNPTPAEKNTCIVRLLSEVRGFISQGIIRLEKVDPEIHIPENIEEILNNAGYTTPSYDYESMKKDASPQVVGEAEEPSPKGSTQEIDFLKRKVNQLVAEVNTLKNENNVLKDKLSQIKRIA